MAEKGGFTLIEVLVTLAVLSVSALGIMKFVSESQGLSAEIQHLDVMSRIAVLQLEELREDGFSSSLSRDGEFEDYPGYAWRAESRLLLEGGWYRMSLTVTREDTGRSVVLERIFRETL